MTSYTLSQLSQKLNATLVGDGEASITGVADLLTATSHDASFMANPRYEQALGTTQAGVIVVSSKLPLVAGKSYLLSDDPSRTFQQLVELFHAAKTPHSCFSGIHKTAYVAPSAVISEGVTLAAYVVVEEGAKIGARTIIGAGSYIGPGTTIGEDCLIHPRVTIREACQIKNRVVIQPGAVIGSCGYGFTTDSQGRHTKLNQIGTVVVEDDVEIGANTTIDRARFQATVIGEGTKIDNLVQIGHGVRLGKHNLIVGQTGIAGSTKTGDHVVLAGQVAVNGHIELGDRVIVTARSAVSKSLLKAGKYGGVPAMPLAEYNRMAVHLQNITELVSEHKAMKAKLDKLVS